MYLDSQCHNFYIDTVHNVPQELSFASWIASRESQQPFGTLVQLPYFCSNKCHLIGSGLCRLQVIQLILKLDCAL